MRHRSCPQRARNPIRRSARCRALAGPVGGVGAKAGRVPRVGLRLALLQQVEQRRRVPTVAGPEQAAPGTTRMGGRKRQLYSSWTELPQLVKGAYNNRKRVKQHLVRKD